jgi:hypothetical protein
MFLGVLRMRPIRDPGSVGKVYSGCGKGNSGLTCVMCVGGRWCYNDGHVFPAVWGSEGWGGTVKYEYMHLGRWGCL